MSNITTEQTYNSIFLEELLQGNKFQFSTATTLVAGGQKKYGIKTGDKKCLIGVQVLGQHVMRVTFNIDATYTTASTPFPPINCDATSNVATDFTAGTGVGGGVFNGNQLYCSFTSPTQPANIGMNKGCFIEGILLDASSTSMILIRNHASVLTSYTFIVSWYEFD